MTSPRLLLALLLSLLPAALACDSSRASPRDGTVAKDGARAADDGSVDDGSASSSDGRERGTCPTPNELQELYDHSCTNDSDCVVVNYSVSCCFSESVSINKVDKDQFYAGGHGCYVHQGGEPCACPAHPPYPLAGCYAKRCTFLPVGGWRSETRSDGLFACFAPDGRAAVGDTVDEMKTACCSWGDGGWLNLKDGQARWQVTDGKLTLMGPPSCTGDGCGPFTYVRDDSLPCFFK